ncbi:MAG: hypothetical protein U5K72_15310 [Balneolaceae bacterium]|nr:hypothetical protein [Balneolaceae bacterium]
MKRISDVNSCAVICKARETEAMCEKKLPGFGEQTRKISMQYNPQPL